MTERILKTVFLIACSMSLIGYARAADYTIKIATVAPDDSPWMKVMKKLDQEIQKASGGALKFKFYAGGVLGDDKQVLDKMRYGQVQAAGFTGVGLGELVPEVRILEIPFNITSYKQYDCLLKNLSADFEKKFESRGYVVLGWADLGFVHLFSKQNIKSIADMSKTKPWVWEGDPLAKAAFKTFGINPTPLSLQDVFTSLQTGLIDTVYNSPVGAIALQWYTKLSYLIDLPIVVGSGAIVVSKQFLDGLPAEYQKLLREKTAEYCGKLVSVTRLSNDKSLKVLQDKGVTLINVDEKTRDEYKKKGKEAAKSLIGKLYDAPLLSKVENLLNTCK